jgi:ribosomal protein S18 acetylase RimI-like enzyme
MSIEPRAATAADLPRLVPLVRDFWREERLPLDKVDVAAVLAALFDHPELGRVLVVERGDALLGYTVITFSFSLEHGGRDALVDELYVVAPERSQGLGTELIEAASAMLREHGVRRLHLEVDHDNPRAHSLYERLGFRGQKRALITRAPPLSIGVRLREVDVRVPERLPGPSLGVEIEVEARELARAVARCRATRWTSPSASRAVPGASPRPHRTTSEHRTTFDVRMGNEARSPTILTASRLRP